VEELAGSLREISGQVPMSLQRTTVNLNITLSTVIDIPSLVGVDDGVGVERGILVMLITCGGVVIVVVCGSEGCVVSCASCSEHKQSL